MKIMIPADVPSALHERYTQNYTAITHGTGRLFLFACDQKIEHLNADFAGNDISSEAQDPEHMFRIAQQGTIGALAMPPGLVARYARNYPTLNYIAKLNDKTSLTPDDHTTPMSAPLYDVHDALELAAEKITMRGVGITAYLGSAREDEMLAFAANAAREAHKNGLIAILWSYPRGPRVEDDQNPTLIAGAAGLGNALGFDFVKVKPPHATANKTSAQNLQTATAAAGNTGVICSGMSLQEPESFLRELHEQLQTGKTSGCATGRNIFQRSLTEAVAMTHAISALVYEKATAEEAINLFNKGI